MEFKIKEPIIKKSKKGIEYFTGHDSNTGDEYQEIDQIIRRFYKTQNWMINRHYIHKVTKCKLLFKHKTKHNKTIRNKSVVVYEAYDSFHLDFSCKFYPKKKYSQYYFVKSKIEFLYAVFTTPEVTKDNLVETLDKMRKYIINEWLPNSGYYFAYEGEILVFDDRYYNSDKKVVEFWMPISVLKVYEHEYEWRTDEERETHLSHIK